MLATPLAGAVEVTPLEATHVAEIQTGGVAQDVQLRQPRDGEDAVYLIQSRRNRQRFRVEVNARHGRLLRIDQVTDDGPEPVYEWPGVRVVAHRGGALLGPPENTLPAIEKAIAVGADLIEIDIRQTADRHLVLMHDETVDRTTDGTGRVDQLTLAEIRRLKVSHPGGATIRVPTLDEALRVMRGRIDPDLDFKEGDVEPLLDVVRDVGLVRQSTMHASWDRCRQLSALEAGIRIRPTADFPQQVPHLVRQLRPAIVNLDWHAVTEEAVRLAHLAGCHAFVNCLERADTDLYIDLAVQAGADYIQSDRPDRVVALLKQRGLRPQRPPRGDPLGTPLRSPKLAYPLR
jgi:glycerophosphoryl diester phosphodiesterase